jgi:filamentous hemagglutinin family protein
LNKLFALPIAALASVFAFALTASPASAQASRTWVSGTGDDVNPCSRTAPCKTFAGAISKTAVNGEINCLDPAGYGSVTITKSITLNCHGTNGSILNAGVPGITIAFDSFTDVRKTVNIRELDIQGFDTGTFGIRIIGTGTGTSVNIEDTVINGDFGSSATGIVDSRTNGNLFIKNTKVRNMGGAGVNLSATTPGLIRATLNEVMVSGSTTGLLLGAGTAATVTRSVFASNPTGISVSSSAQLNMDSSTVSQSTTVGVSNAGTVRLSNNDFSHNTVGTSGSASLTYSNNRFSNSGATVLTPIGSTSNPTGEQ